MFQSLFWWISLLGTKDAILPETIWGMFQSLFWWISLLGSEATPADNARALGFNPCFGGSRSSARQPDRAPRRGSRVSILVLVDLAPRPRRRPALAASCKMFQSLFWWISLLGSWTCRSSGPTGKFQSLFWWISLLGARAHDRAAVWAHVSILVLVDLAPRRLFRIIPSRRRHEFQSLFWWISLLGNCGVKLALSGPGFQSLFWWISLLGAAQHRSACSVAMFQSLFWWISLLGSTPPASVAETPAVFQSLFWWISLLGGRPWLTSARPLSGFNPCFGGSRSSATWASHNCKPAIQPCFNPCFGGSRSSAILGPWGVWQNPTVSILVLVDLAPRHDIAAGHLRPQFRFQSLFWWISLLGSWWHDTVQGGLQVSILVLVDLAPRRRNQ